MCSSVGRLWFGHKGGVEQPVGPVGFGVWDDLVEEGSSERGE